MSVRSESCPIELDHRRLVSLYLILSRHEDELDEVQRSVLNELSDKLFSQLSVSQAENLEAYYTSLV